MWIVKAIVSFFTHLFFSMASENFIEWAFFTSLKKFTDSTKTPVDDEFRIKIENLYHSYMEK